MDRTTDGRGALADHGLAGLRGLDAGGGERIPLLEEVWAMLPATVGVNVELKGRGTGEVLPDALPDDGREILVSSFDLGELAAFHALTPRRALRAALPPPDGEQHGRRTPGALGAWSVNVAEGLIDRRLVERLGGAGFRVLAYTVNDPARAAVLRDLGVAGVFTDYPDRIVAGA